jgi:glyoxylase-like metal-dependent hydrolase (beta-lactamase superfamily II)
MLGEITATQCDDIRVHTYTAPDDGWCVNTHLIELPTQIIAVDAQYTLRYAREIVDYIGTLGKPLTRLYVTHYHPDHLLGAAAFAAPLHALAEVKAKIDLVGDRVAAEEVRSSARSYPSAPSGRAVSQSPEWTSSKERASNFSGCVTPKPRTR